MVPRSHFMAFANQLRKPEALAAARFGILRSTTANQSWTRWERIRTPISRLLSHQHLIWNSSNSMGLPTPRPTTATAIRAPFSVGTKLEIHVGTTDRNKVDGVIAIDIGFSYIPLAPPGRLLPDGETVTQDNVVELTESTLYARFPTDQAARKHIRRTLPPEVVKSGETGGAARKLPRPGRAVSEAPNLGVESCHRVTSGFGTDPLAHGIPDDPAPYAEVVINNLAAMTMDYYLDRGRKSNMSPTAAVEPRLSTVTVRLTNRVADPTGLPDYVAGGEFVPSLAENIPRGAITHVSTSPPLPGTRSHQRPRQWQRDSCLSWGTGAAIQVSKLRLRSILGRLLN